MEKYKDPTKERPQTQIDGRDPMLNLTVYQQQGKEEQKRSFPQTLTYQNYLQKEVANPFYIPGSWGGMHPVLPQLPIVNNYNIRTTGPSDDHLKLNAIYQDKFPDEVSFTLESLGSRISFYRFMRNMMFPTGDEVKVTFKGGTYEGESLLSRIKFLEINPYSYYRFSKNPYRGLPNDFILYRTCYPIRYNPKTNSTECAGKSMSINVRIYKLVIGKNEQLADDIQNDLVWRDIDFYQQVRENILKNNNSPHFPIFMGYFIVDNPNIEFDKINQEKARIKNENERKLNNTADKFLANFQNGPMLEQIKITNETEIKRKAVVALTEAPSKNMIQWASKTYQSNGNVNDMIDSGFHTEEVWNNVLFQLYTAIYTLQKNKIIINDFNFGRNVFVKKINTGYKAQNYWKYIINGIEYYLPNYGYLVMIDSNFKDYDNETTGKTPGYNTEFKIVGKNIGKETKTISDEEYLSKTLEMLKSATNTNQFGRDFINGGGTEPPSKILNLMNEIHKDIIGSNEKDISKYIQRYFRKYLNNRIGTILTEQEKEKIHNMVLSDLRKGDLIAFEEHQEIFRVALITEMDKNTQPPVIKVLTKDRSEHGKDKVFRETNITGYKIMQFGETEEIKQENEPIDFSNNNLLETYFV